MIIQGNNPLEIGKIYQFEVLLEDEKYHLAPMLVLRKSSFQEFLDYCVSKGVQDKVTDNNGPYYYKVSVD